MRTAESAVELHLREGTEMDCGFDPEDGYGMRIGRLFALMLERYVPLCDDFLRLAKALAN